MENDIELCRYCTDSTPLTECVVQEHWERRLKACNLPTSDGVNHPTAPQIKTGGEQIERLIPLTGIHEHIVDRSQLPSGWHSPSSGPVEFRKGTTTYRDINIFESCASPRYNSAGFSL